MCSTCQHLKRPEIDRRLADGGPLTQLAKAYGLSQSSLYRHRTNCLKLGSANAIKKEAARGSAAAALLPSTETLTGSYLALCEHIDRIVSQAEKEGSLRVALTGLSSVRQTLDSLVRLAAHDAATQARTTAPASGHATMNSDAIVERLIQAFDHEPDLKTRLAAALAGMDDEARAVAQQPDPNGGAAVAQDGAGKRISTGDPGIVRAVAAPVLAAINTAHADHATVAACGERCKAVSADGRPPRPRDGSNTAANDANGAGEGKGDTGARHQHRGVTSGPPQPPMMKQTPAMNRHEGVGQS
jgi:hypothetical protein